VPGWALVPAIAAPLTLCAAAIALAVHRNRRLRRRPGIAAGGLVEIAARDEHADALLGPFADRG
jgi:hypothetical protein